MLTRRGGGKTSILQPFSEREVKRWKEYTKHEREQVCCVLKALWEGATCHVQLENMRKLSGIIAEAADCDAPLLLVLVEMHAVCLSRHPLQRAISSLLQNLPEPYSERVIGCVHSTISNVLGKDFHTTHTHRLQYIDVLSENFSRGELALLKQIPIVVQYSVSVINSCHNEKKLMDPLFVTALKTMMSFLHTTQTLVCSLLSGGAMSPHIEITWPPEINKEVKVHWVRGFLERGMHICEEILQTDAGVPHELMLTAAMLYIVIVLRTSTVEDNFSNMLTTITNNWLCSAGSPLNCFSRLSLCHALLAKLSPSSMLLNTMEEPCLLQLFPIICRLFDSFTETSDRYIAARTMALWTTVAKQCAAIVVEDDVVWKSLLPSAHIVNVVLKYVWALWEDPVDGIRHQCNQMFDNIIGVCKQLQMTDFQCGSSSPSPFLLSLTHSLLLLSSPTRGKYQLLSTLSHHIPITTLLSTAPTLPTELLSVMGHQALACHAGALWSKLVKVHWDGDGSVTVWSKTWVETVIDFMLTASPLARQHTIQHCLQSLFECYHNSMHLIQAHMKQRPTASADALLVTELACLHCAKSHIADFVWEKSYENVFIAASHHKDEQIQLSALGILCESHRSTEAPPPTSLPLLLGFLSLNGCTQSPNIRYPIITAFKKLLVRIRDSSYAMKKLHSKKRGPNPHSAITLYQEFLHNLATQLFKSLHPFSSYQRRHMALSVLQLLSSIFPSSENSLQSDGHSNTAHSIASIFEFPNALSVIQARRLVYCLRDSYDANRALVIELLCHLPQETLPVDTEFVDYLVTSFRKLVCSPKAVDCTTASFILRLLLHTEFSQFYHLLLDCFAVSANHTSFLTGSLLDTSDLLPHWAILSVLLSHLHAQLDRAREDLLAASVQTPLYGVMQSIRATLEEAKKTSYDVNVCRVVMSEAIQLCYEVADLASPIVCNSSPEGFLPGAKTLPVSSSSTKVSLPGSSAQSLLLCCWHAMKETSLLLGLIVEWGPIGDSSAGCLLTKKQVDGIASVFIQQLTEARHRGAFEMAYTGFQKLCQSLWNSRSVDFQLMPSRWVNELLESLQSASMSRLLSITRRSAGLPFYVQAILTSETSHTGRPCLKVAMRTLLSVASTCRVPTSVPEHIEPTEENMQAPVADSSSDCDVPQLYSAAVHALNILRALYRESRLGEYVIPFIPEGVEIAVHGFSAAIWPVRNSSTLLFSALVLRIFGAKRVQDEHSVENKMTAREFFTRFPTLRTFLFQQLQRAASELEENAKKLKYSLVCYSEDNFLQLSLFPVLLILSRLYPTALDESNSVTSLEPFLPLLLKCSSCTVWKTRVLISRAVVPLINHHNMETVLVVVLEKMNTHDQNSLHTALLILNRLVIERSNLMQASSGSGVLVGEGLLEHLLNKKKVGFESNQCAVTRCAYWELLSNIFDCVADIKDPLVLEAAEQLLQEARETLMERDWTFMQEDVSRSISKFLIACASGLRESSNNSLVFELCSECLQHSSVAVRLYILQHILDHDTILLHQNIIEFNKLLLNTFCTEEDETVLGMLCAVLAKTTGDLCLSIVENVWVRALELASRTYLRLELRISVLLLLSSVIEKSHDPQRVAKWLSVVEPYTHPTIPVELRQAVATGLGRLCQILLQVKSLQSVEKYCLLVVGLLQDGEEEVRNEMACSIGTILSTIPASVVTTSPHPSPSSALNSFILSLPLILHHQPHVTLKILLHLVDLDASILEKRSSYTSNLLFEEDPLNNYMEEMTVLAVVCNAMKTLIAHHHEQLQEPLSHLVQHLCDIGSSLLVEAKLGGKNGRTVCNLSPWDNPLLFLCLCKVTLVSEAVETVLFPVGCEQLRTFSELKSALCLL